jgi:uncharacterized protein (DUF433 family)
MDQNDLITTNPDTLLGKHVVVGTRVTVRSIVERRAAGEIVEEIFASHPAEDQETALAAIGYAPW